ncbi:MAG: DegT/DnrJ/EryC1/StrS family aminotransferase [Candidatus Omnitrophota bacterium]
MKTIPVSEPLILGKELKYAQQAIESGWISSEGEFINRFEKDFAQYIGKKYAVAVNNGTNALILALRVLDLPKESEVIIPTFTIISCALSCIYNNLIPVFIDCDKRTQTMDVSKIEERISKKTKAIMPVHIYGHPADMNMVLKVAKKHNLCVIEDFAEAIGSLYKGRKCGSFGDINCTSFYGNKLITTGEGGMCLTDNKIFAEKLRRLRNLGFIPQERFVHYDLGFNFRITNVQSAIGCAQLERIEEHVKRKVWIANTYNRALNKLQQKGFISLPVEETWAKNTYWMYTIVLNEKFGVKAKEVIGKLRKKNIQARPFFYPLHLQPAFKKLPWYKKENLPVSEKLYEYGFYLPSGLTLKKEDIGRVSFALEEVLHGFCK